MEGRRGEFFPRTAQQYTLDMFFPTTSLRWVRISSIIFTIPFFKKNWRPQFNRLWGTSFANSHVSELGNRFSSGWAFRWIHSPGWHFIEALWRDTELEDPAKPCPDPQPTGIMRQYTSKKKSYDQPKQHIKKQRLFNLPTEVHLVKAMVFPVVMYGCKSWTIKKAGCRRIDAFELWCWRRLLGAQI